MGATPLPADSKPSSKSAEAFVAANARKLGALLVLFLLGCLGLGTKVWLGFEEASVDLSKVVSGHQVHCTMQYCDMHSFSKRGLHYMTAQHCKFRLWWHHVQPVSYTLMNLQF